MSKMKAAVLYTAYDMRVIDIPKATAGVDGVLMKVKAVGVCGSDLHTYKTGMYAQDIGLPLAGGTLMGHEVAGEVVEVPASLEYTGLFPGDRVAGMALGSYAEFVTSGGGDFISAPTVFKIPNHLSYEEAATVEPLTVSLNCVRRAAPQPGEKVLIIGGGAIGLGCVQVLNALYPDCEIIVADISEKRLDLAKYFGAKQVINAQKEDLITTVKSVTGEDSVLFNPTTTANVDIVIEACGLELTFNQALELAKPGVGRVVVVALYEDLVKADINQIVTKNIQIRGILEYTPDDIKEAIALMASGKVDRKPFITHRFSLENAKDAFEAQIDSQETIKAVIIME